VRESIGKTRWRGKYSSRNVGHGKLTGHTFLEASGALTEWTPRAGAGYLDHSRILPQGDGARPAFTRRAIGGERNLIVLDATDVLHDAFRHQAPSEAETDETRAFRRARRGALSSLGIE
jgi:hypothetical protein